MTLNELADYYERTYLIEPQYVGDRKVAGLRSHNDGKLRLKTLREYFGKRKLREISHSDIDKFRLVRLGTKTKHGKQRSIATVNRDLGILRRVLNVALVQNQPTFLDSWQMCEDHLYERADLRSIFD